MSRLHCGVSGVIIIYTGSCDGPDTGGVTRLHREPWVTSNCSTCQCVNGLVTCQPMNLTTDCPILDCGEDKPIRLEEECCPVCPGML